MLLGIDFDPDQLFEEQLSAEHRSLLSMLRVIEEFFEIPEIESGLRSRPSVSDLPIFRFFSWIKPYIKRPIGKRNKSSRRIGVESFYRDINYGSYLADTEKPRLFLIEAGLCSTTLPICIDTPFRSECRAEKSFQIECSDNYFPCFFFRVFGSPV